MYKILLDDRFYKNTLQQNEYLQNLLNSIKDFFDAKIIFFEPFYTTKNTIHADTMSRMINKRILDTEKVIKCDLNNVKECTNVYLETNFLFDKMFVGKIEYILSKNPQSIVIIPLIYDKSHKKLPIKEYEKCIYFIGNYNEEVDSNIVQWINNNTLIHVNTPSSDCRFPAKELCDGFNNWRSEILKPKYDGDKISDFTKIGLEVALRNKYIYDSGLTALNKRKAKPDKNGQHPKRQVFRNNKKDVYLSTDFENGGFEVYDKNAHHLGQYKFNGDFEKDPDEDSHPLYLK